MDIRTLLWPSTSYKMPGAVYDWIYLKKFSVIFFCFLKELPFLKFAVQQILQLWWKIINMFKIRGWQSVVYVMFLLLTVKKKWATKLVWFKGNQSSLLFNPFTAPACKISRLKNACMHASKQYIWWSCNKSTFNTVHFDGNTLMCSCVGEKRPKWFQIWHFYWSFSKWQYGKHGRERVNRP